MHAYRHTVRVILATLVLLAGLPAFGQDTALTMKDIAKMRHDRMTPDQIVSQAAERGIGFELTTANQSQLRRLGFRPQQIDALGAPVGAGAKDEKPAAPAAPLVAGKGLRTTDDQRNRTLDEIKRITKASGAEVQPVESQHVTLWAARDVQATFLADVKKLEKFFQTKCREPIRSGLDKRAAHVVMLKTRYDYEKWIRAMFDVMGDRFDDPNNPGGKEDMKAGILKRQGLYSADFTVFCMEDQQADWLHRLVAAGIGYMYFTQLAEQRQPDPLTTGFANGAESVLAGMPRVMIFSGGYHNEDRELGNDPRAWLHLVQQRITARQATPVAQLLKMDTSNMVLPHYAEAWTLVSLLAKQPAKLASLVLALREDKAVLAVIQRVYGWDEKQLTAEWHKHVLGQR